MFSLAFRLIDRIKNFSASRVQVFGAQYMPFGIFGVINYPVYYLIWVYLAGQSYENLALRSVATIICIPLILYNKWPNNLKPWLPLYWHVVLLFCLPFFFSFLLLKNHAAVVWLMSTTIVVVWLSYLVDWIIYIILLCVGMLAAYIAYRLTTLTQATLPNGYLIGLIAQYIGTLTVMAIFSNNKQKIQNEKISAIEMAASNVAHELRTPLATIYAGASLSKDYLDDLINKYNESIRNNFPASNIPIEQFEILRPVLDGIEEEVRESNSVIEMLLVNVKQTGRVDTSSFSSCSISNCISEALNRYTFSIGDRELVAFNGGNDFLFWGSNELTVHILFNLIKNAIYSIKASGKGSVQLWIDDDNKFNSLHFRDTGSGMDKETLTHLFDRFYSKTYHGYGIGLAFCKSVMESYGGNITCESIKGEYTEFILKFPKDTGHH